MNEPDTPRMPVLTPDQLLTIANRDNGREVGQFRKPVGVELIEPAQNKEMPMDEDNLPTVCIAHGRFIPCRGRGNHRTSSNPFWVKSVRDYQSSTIPGITWEPAT